MRVSTAIAVAFGMFVGVGAYAFVYARGASYLTNDATACANCHVMLEHYAAWLKSSHRMVAACNDCHTPSHPVGKYATKASNGFWHSFAFTTGRFPDAIQITGRNRTIAETACLKCHEPLVESLVHQSSADQAPCLQCHSQVGHLR